MAGLTIQVFCTTKTEWTRNTWQVGAGENDELNWADDITQTPAEKVSVVYGGTSAAAESETFSTIVKDALWMRLGYKSTEGEFAVELRQLFHLFGFGSQCEWSRFDTTNGGWRDHGHDTAKYTWYFPNTFVEADPTLSADTGIIALYIRDIEKKH
jgi:hypothetical protein